MNKLYAAGLGILGLGVLALNQGCFGAPYIKEHPHSFPVTIEHYEVLEPEKKQSLSGKDIELGKRVKLKLSAQIDGKEYLFDHTIIGMRGVTIENKIVPRLKIGAEGIIEGSQPTINPWSIDDLPKRLKEEYPGVRSLSCARFIPPPWTQEQRDSIQAYKEFLAAAPEEQYVDPRLAEIERDSRRPKREIIPWKATSAKFKAKRDSINSALAAKADTSVRARIALIELIENGYVPKKYRPD